MIKVAGDTSTCPPPESVTMEQTVTKRKRQGKCPEKERSSMVAREDRKQKKYYKAIQPGPISRLGG